MKDDLVSIITPAYNAEKYIEETINSVLEQTYQNWEMIIINDCSIDNTKSVVEKYNDKRIKLINLIQNEGAASAWNRAIKMAEGRFIAFLDSDDLWVNTKLEQQLSFMRKNNYAFTYGSYDWIDSNGNTLSKTIKASKKKTLYTYLSNTNIGTLTVVLDKKYINIPNIENRRIHWDCLMWSLILETGIEAYGYPEIIGHYRILSNSVSRNKKNSINSYYSICKSNLKIPFFKRIFLFAGYAFNSIRRYYLR